jgi:hypothetical protein
MLRSNKKSLFVVKKTKEGIHAICFTQAAAKKSVPFCVLKNNQVYQTLFFLRFLFFFFIFFL